MSEKTEVNVKMFGAGTIFIVLLVLKVAGIVNIPWWLVFLPLYLGFLILGVFIIAMLIGGLGIFGGAYGFFSIKQWLENRKKNKDIIDAKWRRK